MDAVPNIAARMRQDPGGSELDAALERLRPWQDERAVCRALVDWARGRTGPRNLDGTDVSGVADHLRALGAGPSPPDPSTVGAIAAFMLRNVALGRAENDNSLLGDVIVGAPARTVRYYRRRFGDLADAAYLEGLQYDLDLARLVSAGVKPGAARRRLERARR